jgi:hypothetical protein
MPWDLRWKDSKDLEFSPSMDIALTSGEDLIEQRILLRLIMMRGWIYDTTGELGSNLWTGLAKPTVQTAQEIPALVLEALSPMEAEISIDDVTVTPTTGGSETSLLVVVDYSPKNNLGNPTRQRITFPLT